MNRPDSPTIVVTGTRGTVEGKTNHGGHHLAHINELGIPAFAVDTKPFGTEQVGQITHFQGTLQDFFRRSE